MKKVFFIMFFMAAGLASANTSVKQEEVTLENETKKEGNEMKK